MIIDALLDTTVVLHLYRKYQPAIVWFNNQQYYGVTSTTWLEVVEGASSKANLAQCKNLLSQFELFFTTSTDQLWAMQQLERFQFSHHIGQEDCLIASVAHRLQISLYIHNLKDMTPLIGNLPYV